MIRQFADRAVTTLASGISTGDTALTLTSDTGFPAAPFDLRIGQELMLVRARSGVNCTLVDRAQGGTNASNHLAGVEVRHVITAAALRSLLPVLVRKTSDTSRTSNSVLSNDPDLAFPIAANEVWQFTFVLFVVSTSQTPDIKLALSVPSGATVFAGATGSGATASGTNPTATNNAFLPASAGTQLNMGLLGSTAPVSMLITYRGTVVNGANAGAVTLQWAQLTSNAAATVVLTHSHVIAREVAA